MNLSATGTPAGAGFLMRALVLESVGGLEHLIWAEVPAPQVRAPHDVRVRLRAAALNRLDLFRGGWAAGGGVRLPPHRGVRWGRGGGIGRQRRHQRAPRRPGHDQSRRVVRHLRRVCSWRRVTLCRASGTRRASERHTRRNDRGTRVEPRRRSVVHVVAPGGRVLPRDPHRVAHARNPCAHQGGRHRAHLGRRRWRGTRRGAGRRPRRSARHRYQQQCGEVGGGASAMEQGDS